MASYLNLMSPIIINLGMTSATKFTYGRCRAVTSKRSTSNLTIRAVQENEGPRRLVDIIRTVPELSRNYFRSPSRRALFGGISLLGGFYVAQTISLSFGALGVNDVIAAVICVLLTEYVTRFYYSRPKGQTLHSFLALLATKQLALWKVSVKVWQTSSGRPVFPVFTGEWNEFARCESKESNISFPTEVAARPYTHC